MSYVIDKSVYFTIKQKAGAIRGIHIYEETPAGTMKRLANRFLKRRGPRRSSGQALVEFALLLPMLTTLMLGAVDFGRAMYAVVTVNNAAFHSSLWAANKLRYGTAGGCASSTSYCCPTENNTTAINTTTPTRIRDVVIRDFLVGLGYTDTCPSTTSSVGSTCNPSVSCSTSTDSQSYRYVDVTVSYRWSALGPYGPLVGTIDIPRTVRIRRLP